MARTLAAPVPGTRVRITPRERAAVEAYESGAKERVARRMLGAASGLMALVSLLLLIAGLAGPSPGQRHDRQAWMLLLLSGMLLGASSFFLWAMRRRARRLAEDLAVGSKLVVDGIVDDKRALVRNGITVSCVVRIVVPPSKEPGNFAVPERVFERLSKGDAVRCAYLPASKVLLSLDAKTVFHAIGDAP